MDLLIICLPYSDYKVYLFQLTQMCNNDARRFPRALRELLEDPAIKKVGNRIPCDVAKLDKWNVKMTPIVELGHLMCDRALTPTRAPSLETIIDTLFPGVELEGKHGGADSVRTSDWSMCILSNPQIEYASADGYATGVSLRAALQVMDPKVQARILTKDAVDGMEVTLYRSKWKGRVAKGTIRGIVGNNKVRVEIDLTNKESIYSSGTYVDMLGDNNAVLCQKSLDSLLEQCENSEMDSPLNRVCIIWPLYFCRRTINMSGSDNPIICNTEMKLITADHSDDLQQQNFDDDNRSSASSSSDSSYGETDNLTILPRNRRRRLNHYRRERVKINIVHIFFRHQHVLSKEHGAYFTYMTALRDAFYIINQDDLDQCLHVLREKKKLSKKDICLKLKYDFDWFLRRVRRLVPEPPVLEKRYTEVFDQYKDIECSNRGCIGKMAKIFFPSNSYEIWGYHRDSTPCEHSKF
jgi:hypothetical protein